MNDEIWKMKSETHELKSEIKEVKKTQKDIDDRVRRLETRTTINEQSIITIQEDLHNIKSDTRWILRLIIGGIVMSILTMIIQS